MSIESGCGRQQTRSVRNNSVYTGGSIPSLQDEYKDFTLYDFVLLASSVPATGDLHYAGHRVNTVLNTGSFNIGTGNSFTVRGLAAECPNSDASFVAIKIPVAAFNKNKSTKMFSSQLRAACLELRILSHPPLRSHNNIVELLGIAWVRDVSSFHSSEDTTIDLWPVLVLERSTNGSLTSLTDMWEKMEAKDDMDSSKTLSTEAKLALCLDVARGLKALHDCDIVHGDMKCENILLFGDAPNFTAKLADFGHSVTELDEREGLRANTPPWNAPEDNGDLNFIDLKAADIYCLGFVLWRILADGQHPFAVPRTGSLLESATIEVLKQGDGLCDMAHATIGRKIDFCHWILLGKPVRAILFSSLNPNPLVRSLRHVVNCLDDSPESTADSESTYTPESEDQAKVSVKPKVKIWGKETMAKEDEEEDEQNLFNNADVLPQTEYLSPNLSVTLKYSLLVRALQSSNIRIRRVLADSLIRAHVDTTRQNQRKIARTLFVYFLEIDHRPDEALKWLLSTAASGDVITQPIVYRIYSALGKAVPNHIPVKEWLWNGALRGSTVALEDLKTLDSILYQDAKRLLNTKYGGIGIDMFQGFEATVRGLAAEVLRVAELQVKGGYDGPGDPGAHVAWAAEIMESLVQLPQHADDENCWEPEWSYQPEEWHQPWKKYAQDPENALRDTFRIEDDMIYYVNAIGDTVLHYAASRGFLKLLEYLYTTYEPPYTVLNICYETPLLQACRAGHGKTITFLLDQGANPKFPSRRGELPLHWMFNVERELMPGIARRLLSCDLSPGDEASYPDELHLASDRETQVGTHVTRGSALEWAILRGDPCVLRCLLGEEYGKYSQENQDIWSAICCASQFCLWQCLSVLLRAAQRYGDGSLDGERLYDAVRSAVADPMDGMFTQLLRHGNNRVRAFKQTLSLLEEAGVVPCSDGSSPKDGFESVMALAVMNASPEIVDVLLQSGWVRELGTPGPQRQPPIALAAIEGREEVFESILAYEDLKTLPQKFPILSDGSNVYYWMAKSNNPSLRLAERLLSLGIMYHESSIRSPFEMAVRNGEFEMADFFLDRCGADIERTITYGYGIDSMKHALKQNIGLTLLGSLVIENTNYLWPSIEYLLRCGANALVNTGKNLNVFHICAIGSSYDYDTEETVLILPKLVRSFPDKTLVLQSCKVLGSTPLEWAVQHGNSSAVRIYITGCGLWQ
ncbi:hypothetical protein K440DRAFT_601291 [Wilcoxina mikolae CBS 423.85]|nr:hypothetical protein K440DRAFT_601291 [Wilcoxina mikolae CBS 423.85]